MTALAPLASIGDTLVTIGLWTLGVSFVASAAVAIAATCAYRYTTKAQRRYPAAPAPDPQDRIRVIGGNRVSSHERWGKAA